MRLVFAAIAFLASACAREAEPPRAVAQSCAPIRAIADPQSHEGMVLVRGGEASIGSTEFHAEERPVRTVRVGDFWIDAHEVTNAEFAAFVRATNYVTVAERDRAGGAVFFPRGGNVDYRDLSTWWRLDPDATWRTPSGAGSSIEGRDAFPVVQVAHEDALAYARWRGRDLPTEAEWEYAARGGLQGAAYAWGEEARPGGQLLANHYQGLFPFGDSGADGYEGAAPAGCFPANGYGLYDMTGNVWEWTRDAWRQAALAVDGFHTIKGGSFLCSDQFCARYRPAARQPGDDTMGTEHIGFRTVWHGSEQTE
ncbi:sulfatase modifying factor 1 precursor [alpha proteobacterium U9-1i]|nr:sulfatase modifying factor 1 precursor [alpha proteobacterium U9-1i]